ncbi:MAG TPA: hypothetical protein VLB01_03745 [Thermodesulfobacteriota bacterium]|nr:hypothetical protein [Thermodesulfobacteriota bacterium]
MFMVHKISWWYWLLSSVFLAIGVLGLTEGFYMAIALTAIQVLHFTRREKSMIAFPVQVRVAYLALLLCGLWDPFKSVYWIPLIGTIAMVVSGYCLLARVLSLMPWNRREPLSFRLVTRTFLSPPVEGNIMQGLPEMNSKMV